MMNEDPVACLLLPPAEDPSCSSFSFPVLHTETPNFFFLPLMFSISPILSLSQTLGCVSPFLKPSLLALSLFSPGCLSFLVSFGSISRPQSSLQYLSHHFQKPLPFSCHLIPFPLALSLALSYSPSVFL